MEHVRVVDRSPRSLRDRSVRTARAPAVSHAETRPRPLPSDVPPAKLHEGGLNSADFGTRVVRWKYVGRRPQLPHLSALLGTDSAAEIPTGGAAGGRVSGSPRHNVERLKTLIRTSDG